MALVNWTDRLKDGIKAEIDINHPWTQKFRVPVTEHIFPQHAYIATLTEPRPGVKNYQNYQVATETEAELIGRFIEYRKLDFFAHYRRQVEAWLVDIDPGVNTVSFAKQPGGWVYRRGTWQGAQVWPGLTNPNVKYPDLRDLLDKVNEGWDETPNPKWLGFMDTEVADFISTLA